MNKSDRTRGNVLKFHRGGLDLVLGKFVAENVVSHWNKVPREVVESLEVFEKHVDMAFG